MTALCPHCGYSLQADQTIYRDGWMVNPLGLVAYKGPALRLRISWAGILHTLAAASGFVRAEALLNRISDSDTIKVVHVQISLLRRWMRANGLPDPILTDRAHAAPGYRWNDALSVQTPIHSTLNNSEA